MTLHFMTAKNLAILWDLKKYWHVLKGRTFFNFASSYFSCNRKRTVVQVEQRQLVIKLNLINTFGILKYASGEPYIFPRKIPNYYSYFCLLCFGNFFLQEYVGALLGSLLSTLLHRAEVPGMVIKLEFIKQSRKKKKFQDYLTFKKSLDCLLSIGWNSS